MSTNQYTELNIFTNQQLREHDLNLAKAVCDATTKHVARKMIEMNSGQQLKSMTDNCKSLKLDDDVLGKLADLVLTEEKKKRK